jgi:hypothetical protein
MRNDDIITAYIVIDKWGDTEQIYSYHYNAFDYNTNYVEKNDLYINDMHYFDYLYADYRLDNLILRFALVNGLNCFKKYRIRLLKLFTCYDFSGWERFLYIINFDTNVAKFTTNTCMIEELPLYLTQIEIGDWGTYLHYSPCILYTIIDK